jgi:hypothetical protein
LKWRGVLGLISNHIFYFDLLGTGKDGMEQFSKQIEYLKVIGKGSYGKVMLVRSSAKMY